MTNRLGSRVVFLSLLGATGCGGGEDLLLGQAELTSDAGSEQPMEEDAGGEAPAPAADAGSARTCKGDLAGWPKVELFVRDIPEATCATPPCEFQAEQLEVAEDGSVWIAGGLLTGSWERNDLWIGHFSPTGEALGSARVKSYGSAALLAVDDQEHAWLVAGDPARGLASYLYRFDESVREVSRQALPTAYRDLVRYPQHGVLLSGAGRALQAIGYDGRELWSTTERRRAGTLAVDDTGRIILATQELFDRPDPERPESMLHEWFAEGGSPLPESTPVQASFPADGPTRPVGGVELVASDKLTLGYATSSGDGTMTQHIERWDEKGALQWRWDIPESSDRGMAVDPITGTTLALGPMPSAGLALTAISPDGKQCRRFGIDGPAYGLLSVGPKGEIWFVTIGKSQGYQSMFGRLERPDLRW